MDLDSSPSEGAAKKAPEDYIRMYKDPRDRALEESCDVAVAVMIVVERRCRW